MGASQYKEVVWALEGNSVWCVCGERGGNYATAKYASRQRKERRTLDTEDKHKYKYINNTQLVRMS